MSVLLALKLLLAPASVVLSSLASRRWGPRFGGILGTIPIVAGLILLIIWLGTARPSPPRQPRLRRSPSWL